MGDRLGTLDAVDFFLSLVCVVNVIWLLILESHNYILFQPLSLIRIVLRPSVNGHITLNTPALVRSLKLSNVVESSQYLEEGFHSLETKEHEKG